ASAENRIDLAGAAKLNKEIIIDRRKLATKKRAWAGRIISAVAVSFLVLDGVMKLMNAVPVVEAQNQLGLPQNLTPSDGILELVCVLVYTIPGSSILGAILLTGYLGGATAIQLRVGNPLFTHLLFPTYVGAFLWGSLYLRDERLRQVLTLRNVVRRFHVRA